MKLQELFETKGQYEVGDVVMTTDPRKMYGLVYEVLPLAKFDTIQCQQLVKSGNGYRTTKGTFSFPNTSPAASVVIKKSEVGDKITKTKYAEPMSYS